MQNSFDLMARLVGLSLIVQVLEVLRFKNMWNGVEVYQTNNWLFKKSVFKFLLFVQLAACCGLVFSGQSALVVLALIINAVIFLRFRGVVNGGSDYMTALVLAGCTIYYMSPNVGLLSLLYIGFQVILSYFISGWVKIENPQFRNGSALHSFFNLSNYSVPSWALKLSESRRLMLMLSWSVIVFELLAPLVIFSPKFALVFMILAMGFHFGNFLVFGLNRFFFAWLAAYPALYFLVVYISSKLPH